MLRVYSRPHCLFFEGWDFGRGRERLANSQPFSQEASQAGSSHQRLLQRETFFLRSIFFVDDVTPLEYYRPVLMS